MAVECSSTNLITSFATTQDQQIALQFAFFNTLLFLLTGICLCGLFALYKMMYMFLSPLMWSVLVGTVLFPFKKTVTDCVQGWLDKLQETNTTLAMGLLTMPFFTFIRFSEKVYATAMSKTGLRIIGAYFILKILTYERTFVYLIECVGHVYRFIDAFIIFYSATWVFPLMLIYLCAYTSWIYVQQPTAINKKVARGFSLPIWIYGLSCISYYFGVFKAAVFGTLTIILTLLSIGVWVVEDSKDSGDVKESTVGPVDHDVPVEKSDAVTIVSLDKAFGSDSLILMMAGLCVLSWIVRHDAALFFIFIPFLFAVFRKIGANVGFSSTITTLCISVRDHLYPSFKKIVDTTISGYLRQFVKVLFTSDQMLVSSLHSKMDVLSSLVVMGFLACSVIFSLLFIGFQLHSETVHIVRLTNNVVSSRPDWLGAAMNFTEDQLEGHDINIDKYVEKAYQQGRAYLASNIRALADTKDTARADMLEEQVMKVVDNLYKMWEERNSASEATTPNGLRGDRKTQLMSLTNLNTFKEEIILIVKENIDMLTSIASSVWGIVSANIAFLLTLMGALAGLILNFGLDIINLVIEVIVFLTMVYYLLSASRDRWLPIEWISNLATLTSISSNKSSTTSVTENDVTIAIEQAIFLLILPLLFVFAAMFSGVFVLSSKMAIFYGLYTYFIHTLFDLNVVFVPCMLAALFAAIPIMPTYIVSLFGVFELWLVRGELSATVVFAVLSFAPQMFANATFYKEVKFSHPYVTGLAIIGGMYWLGLEGAIIGPIILCSFLVLINVYMQVARPCGGKLKAG